MTQDSRDAVRRMMTVARLLEDGIELNFADGAKGLIPYSARERLERERRKRGATALAQALHTIGKRCAALLAPGPGAVEHGKVLYDERGLPKQF